MFRFSIRELMLVTVIAVLAVQLWREHHRADELHEQVKKAATRVEFLEWKKQEIYTTSGKPFSVVTLDKVLAEDQRQRSRFAGQPPPKSASKKRQ